MTVLTIHDDNVSNLKVGQTIKQGTIYFQPGNKGISKGSHIHIAVGKGKFKGNGCYKGQYQPKVKTYAWYIYNQYDIPKALFIDKNVKQTNPLYKWKVVSDTSSPSNITQKYEIGESVIIDGNLYKSSNDTSPSGTVKNKTTKITRYAKGSKHPYNTTGDLGWMDESKEYFNKLQNTLGKEYKLNYYEIDTDDNLTNLKISSEIEVEKIIRLITLKDEKFDNGNLKLGVITLYLSDIKDNKGNQLFKELLEKIRNTFKEEEVV